MKQIVLPNKELRLLSSQLQQFNQGFTVPQIRSLDKVVKVMEETLKSFSDGLDKILSVVVSQVTPEKKAEAEEKKRAELDEFVKTEGEKIVTCTLEDADLDFIKEIWGKMATFSGVKEAREAIIKIDEALNKTTEPVFTNHEPKTEMIPTKGNIN